MISKSLLFLFACLLLATTSFAHDDDVNDSEKLEKFTRDSSTQLIIVSIAILAIIVLYALTNKKKLKSKKANNTKIILFSLIVLTVTLTTLYVAGMTLYLNFTSDTKGPIHWHTDFEVWACDEKLDMLDPKGFSNRIGNPVFHEHGDDRIHVEGVVIALSSIRMHEFMQVTGSHLAHGQLDYNTNKGIVTLKDGQLCNSKPAMLQGFLYRIENPKDHNNWVYTQSKLENYEDYLMAPQSLVPPGDCIILELDEEKQSTDKICETYKIAIDKGELRGS